jgi:Ca-activated chloride channel family protein
VHKGQIWLFAAVAVLIGAIGTTVRNGLITPGGGMIVATADSAIHISMANSSTKELWLHRAVDAFNSESPREARWQVQGKSVFVDVIQEVIDGKKADYRSGTMVTDTLDGRIKPTILSPGDETWIARLNDDWQGLHNTPATTGQAPVVAQTPLVVTMWQSRAKALGCWPNVQAQCTWQSIGRLASDPNGWASMGQPAWGKFKFGYGYVGESNSGTLSAVLMCTLGVGKTGGLSMQDVQATNGCGQTIAALETAKVHSGTKSDWLLGQMLTGGPEYLDAVVTNEAEVVAFNEQNGPKLREPLVAAYPHDGTILFGHPYAILDGVPWVSPEQVSAAEIFREFLLSNDQQAALVSYGLRPVDPAVQVGPPIEGAHGANPDARLVAIGLPEPLVIRRVQEVWHQVKKPAAIALVFDKSGSMGGGKITAAIAGTKAFLDRMDSADWIYWLPFDGTLYPGVGGPKSDIGERLVDDVTATTAGGNTALYDAILSADSTLEGLRRERGDRYRYGIVVLSDGADTSSGTSLAQLEAQFRTSEVDPGGVQIHTIGIGSDADQAVLTRIANSAHGKFWKGNSSSDMVAIYQAIATYY